MQPDYMIRYEFEEESGDIATDEETIIIGFSTQEKKGILMHIRNDDKDKPEYISVEMNNNGKTPGLVTHPATCVTELCLN